jgi:hypothetical protein
MRKYLRVIPIIVSALLVSLVGTIFVDKGSLVDASHLQNLTNIVSIFTSLVLVAIGLILYEKFNGSQAIVDEQTKQVVSLLKIVNQTRFAVDVMYVELA